MAKKESSCCYGMCKVCCTITTLLFVLWIAGIVLAVMNVSVAGLPQPFPM